MLVQGTCVNNGPLCGMVKNITRANVVTLDNANFDSFIPTSGLRFFRMKLDAETERLIRYLGVKEEPHEIGSSGHNTALTNHK
jgi:hypothetical protein